MTKSETRLIAAALRWWRGHKPIHWTAEEHMQTPVVNAGYTTHSRALALAAAAVAKDRARK